MIKNFFYLVNDPYDFSIVIILYGFLDFPDLVDVVVVLRDQLIEGALVGVGQWPLGVLAGALAEDGLGDGDYLGDGQILHGGADWDLGIEMGAVAGGLVFYNGALGGVEVEVERGAAAGGVVGEGENMFIMVAY